MSITKRHGRLILVALAGLAILLSLGLFRDRDEFNVPVPVNWRGDNSLSPEPVLTTLHEYRSDNRPYEYRTTGKSVTFVFPAMYYFYHNNIRGGPQNEVMLDVSRIDLSPIKTYYRNIDQLIITDPKQAKRNEAYVRENNLELSVSTNALGGSRPFQTERNRLANGKRVIGARCGMLFATPEHAPYPYEEQDDGVLRRDLYMSRRDMWSVPLAEGNPSRTLGASCNSSLDTCQVSFDYDGFNAEYRIKKRAFCTWPQETLRIRKFLDEHVHSRTRRRS